MPPGPYTDLQTALPFPTSAQTQSQESYGVGYPPSIPAHLKPPHFCPSFHASPMLFHPCWGPYSQGLDTQTRCSMVQGICSHAGLRMQNQALVFKIARTT